MAFDPDAYISGNGGFDPDAYLAGKSTASDIAAMGSKAVTSSVTAPEDRSIAGTGNRFMEGLKESFLPNMESLKRIASPVAGEFGLSRFLEQEGKNVGQVTRSAAQNIADKFSQSKFGQANPNLAGAAGATLGTAVDVASDSLTPSAMQQQAGAEGIGMAANAPEFQVAVNEAGKVASKIGAFFSGKRPQDYARLAKDPVAILPEILGGPKSMGKAGKELGEAVDSAGIAKSLNPNPDYSGTVNKAWAKVMEDVPTNLPEAEQIKAMQGNVSRLSAQETFDAYNSLKKIIKSQVENKDKELMRARVIFQNSLKDRLGSLSGQYAEASKEYGRAALRGNFTDILPTTKYGVPSIGRAGFASAILGKMALPVSSPLIHGLLTAGGSGGLKVIQSLLSNPGTATATLYALKAYMAHGGKEAMPEPESAKASIPASGFSAILQRARQRQSGEVSDEGLNDFVNKSPVGTKFRYQGRNQKIVPAKTRNTAGLSKENKSALFASKRLNKGRNTFAPA